MTQARIITRDTALNKGISAQQREKKTRKRESNLKLYMYWGLISKIHKAFTKFKGQMKAKSIT